LIGFARPNSLIAKVEQKVGQAMTQSDYSRRFDAAVAELDAAGVPRSKDLPGYVKLGRKLGLEPRHPYYISSANASILSGLFFGVSMGLMNHFRSGGGQTLPLYFEILYAVLLGLFFGLFMGRFHRHYQKKYRLSKWEDL
jgi:hypothetical protein